MSADPTEKLLNIGIIAGLAAAAFLAYKFFTGTPGLGSTPKCPAGEKWVGDCEGTTGLPGLLCGIGGFVAGAQGQCVPTGKVPPVVPLPKDEHGCIIGVQHYCEAPDRKCRDKAQACTPAESPGSCYEWSPLFGKWIYSPTMPGCVPTKLIPVIPKCAESECTPGAAMCAEGIPKVCVPLGTGCEDRGLWANGGSACKPKSVLKQCASGAWVDLNNKPGITLEEACRGSANKPILNEFFDDCIRGCGQTKPGQVMCVGSREACNASGATVSLGENLYANQLAIDIGTCMKACETDTSRNDLANPREVAAFIAGCPGLVGGLPVDTPVGRFEDGRAFCDRFGHTFIDQITKGYAGGTFPHATNLVCYKQNPRW